jgi:hypothetical protein
MEIHGKVGKENMAQTQALHGAKETEEKSVRKSLENGDFSAIYWHLFADERRGCFPSM